jgi:hypothetical protein
MSHPFDPILPPPQGGRQRSPLDIPIVQALYATYAYWNDVLLKFPKSQRYALGQTCSQYLLGVLEHVLSAAQTVAISEKIAHLKQASVKQDALKLLIRLCKDTSCMTNSQYLQMESKLQETGRMLGGWIKSLG